ncbi:MAG: zinc-binding alcohol dehydrogenase family protein [Pseudomonadota bacterium]
MKAWMLEKPGGRFGLETLEMPEATPGSVIVDMKATPLLSYTRTYLNGDMPYAYPDRPFIPGTNGVGIVKAVGASVDHVKPGDRVLTDPYLKSAAPVADPAQILIGLTGISPDSDPMLHDWADGTWTQIARFPASTVFRADGLDAHDDEALSTIAKFIVPFGGLRKGGFGPGQILVVHGATGYFGSAAVLLGLALGAEKVIATGRSIGTLQALAETAGDRVVPVAMTGDVEQDAAAIKDAAGGPIHMAYDMVGGASSANGTLAALTSLSRGGILVLMGSMTVPLPLPYGEVLLNNWRIAGNFMYTVEDYLNLISLIRAGHLDLSLVKIKSFAFEDIETAIDATGKLRGLENVTLLVD